MGSAHIAAQSGKSSSRWSRRISRGVSITGISISGRAILDMEYLLTWQSFQNSASSDEPKARVTNGTFPNPSGALQFAHGHHYTEEVSLHAMRDDGRPLRLRKILLPLPIAGGGPPLRR